MHEECHVHTKTMNTMHAIDGDASSLQYRFNQSFVGYEIGTKLV